MSTILQRFSKYLTRIEYPKEKTSWNIAGVLKDKNAFYRFDVREMAPRADGTPVLPCKTNTQAEKMVFELNDKWVILDVKQIHEYLITHDVRNVQLRNLFNKLEWTMEIPKVRQP